MDVLRDGFERELQFVVEPAQAGQRLDVFLAGNIEGLSRSRAQRLIDGGHVAVMGRSEKASAPLQAGSVVSVSIPPPMDESPSAEALPLSILYDDADVVVVNKTAGVVVHPAAGNLQGTLVNALLHHVRGLSGIGGRARPGIVHRLDKGTSGVMVVAKHDRAHAALSQQFQDRLVLKEYLALVWGAPERGQVFDSALGRDPRDRKKISSRAPKARTALTTVLEVEVLDALSLVRVSIGSGRTHQIRVHLSEAGFPVAGDELYGGVRKKVPPTLAVLNRLDRPFLHAARLRFAHPSDGTPRQFDAPLPPDLTHVLSTLRRVAGTPAARDEAQHEASGS